MSCTSRSRGRRGRYRDDFDDGDEIDAAGVDYEVVEVSDGDCYIDHWIAADGQLPTFGRLPLAENGELLPAGALDDEPPDEDRLLEATGNEGVSFERAYRRAALILWPQERQVEVLLQSGVGAALTRVCRKTRESYRRQCRQHAEDIAAMRALQALGVAALDADCARLVAAAAREPQALEG